MDFRSLACAILASSCSAFLPGCASYYMVRDPGSDTTYYTSNIDRKGDSGAVRFKDGRTDTEVTLQNSEVTEISRAQFKKSVP